MPLCARHGRSSEALLTLLLVAEPIAIWGAITGTLALAVNVWREVRDRPKLRLTFKAHAGEDGTAYIGFDVANTGRRPVAIVEAGFVIAVEVEITNASRPEVPARNTLPRLKLLDDPTALAPGEVRRVRQDLAKWPHPFLHADFPIRPFVVDSFGRTVWGSADAMMRRLLEFGWPPPPGTPENLLEYSPEPIEAVPAVARWKVWKPRGVRKGLKREQNYQFNFSPPGDS